MTNQDDRSNDSTTPRSEEKDPMDAGRTRGEPNSDTEPREGQKPVQEYPGEGVGSHYPTEPKTTGGTDEQADGSGDDTADSH
jgi:hypothetical protein